MFLSIKLHSLFGTKHYLEDKNKFPFFFPLAVTIILQRSLELRGNFLIRI